jgi:hypothetical protein
MLLANFWCNFNPARITKMRRDKNNIYPTSSEKSSFSGQMVYF